MLSILRQLTAVAPLLARHLAAYLELAADDSARLAQELLRRLLMGAAALLGVMLILAIICGWVIASAWDTPWRSVTIIALLVACGGLTAGAAIFAWGQWPEGEGPFARLVSELRSDGELIDQLAGADEVGEMEPATVEPNARTAG